MVGQIPTTAADLAAGLGSGQYSSVELTRLFLERIARLDTELNAFITVCEETALEQAAASDRRRAAGNVASPLDGIPYAHKDIFCTQGIRTSCASRMLDNFEAPYDAHVTTLLRNAGLIMLGKTNMDEFAMGSSNESSYYGPARNPWDLSRVPGGSSGGSAAAVAAGLTPLATGTDTGGSIRQPAALCGISGLKPTYGRVSRFGMVAFASSLDQGGPMATSAQDLALMLSCMAGFDERDSTSIAHDVEDFTAEFNQFPKGLRLGIPSEYFSADLDPAVGDAVMAAADEIERQGAVIQEISLPTAPLAVPAYYVVASAECSSNLSRYDGVRFGYRCDAPRDLTDLYERSRSEAFGAEVKRRILVGTYALSSGYYDDYYRKAQQIRRLIRDDFARAFESVDVIIGPTTPQVAFPIGSRNDDPVTMYLSDVYTTAANLAGLPAVSIPAGLSEDLPIGLQVIGPHFAESRILSVAHQYQRVTDWHAQRPVTYA